MADDAPFKDKEEDITGKGADGMEDGSKLRTVGEDLVSCFFGAVQDRLDIVNKGNRSPEIHVRIMICRIHRRVQARFRMKRIIGSQERS